MGEHNFLDLDASPDRTGDHAVPVGDEWVHEVREFCTTWVRAVKTICLYPSTNPLPDEFRQKFYHAIERLLEDHGRLALTSQDHGFRFNGETVYQQSGSEENIAYLFFRDGIREIAFEPGITRQDTDRFLAILATAFAPTTIQSDLANDLWEAGFSYIKHYTVDRVVEGVYIDVADDKTLASIHERFITSSEVDVDAFADGEPDDASPYEGFQKERYLHVMEIFGEITELTVAEIHEITALDNPDSDAESERMGLDVLAEILRGAENSQMSDDTIAIMEKQLERWILADRWDMVRLLLAEWYQVSSGAPPRLADRLRGALTRAADRRHFEQLARYLNAHPKLEMEPVRSLLSEFGASAITPITAMLGSLDHRPARVMVCDFLASHGNETIDLIGGFVYDKRWYVVRNVVHILGELKNARALTFLRKSSAHADLRVRLETLRALSNYSGDATETILLTYLKDSECDLRKRALRMLGHLESRAALPELRKQVLHSSLIDQDTNETRELLNAYARIGGDDAAADLIRLSAKTRFFGKTRWLAVRQSAILALGCSPSMQARSELQVVARKHNTALAQSARMALSQRDHIGLETDDQEVANSEDQV